MDHRHGLKVGDIINNATAWEARSLHAIDYVLRGRHDRNRESAGYYLVVRIVRVSVVYVVFWVVMNIMIMLMDMWSLLETSSN